MKKLNEAKILAQQRANDTGIVHIITEAFKIYPKNFWSGQVLATINPEIAENEETEKPTKSSKSKDKAEN